MASLLSQAIAHDLFVDAGVNRKARRLVLESEGEHFAAAGWGEKSLADRVDLSLQEVRDVLALIPRLADRLGTFPVQQGLTGEETKMVQRARDLMEKLRV